MLLRLLLLLLVLLSLLPLFIATVTTAGTCCYLQHNPNPQSTRARSRQAQTVLSGMQTLLGLHRVRSVMTNEPRL